MTSCRRAFEADIPAFVREPRRAEWRDFRDHYPRCADCAAEVRAWAELDAALAASGDAGHPSEETLLDFAERPGVLGADSRAFVERHVHACATCADELRALARFDGAIAAVGAADTTTPGWMAALRRVLGGVGSVVLHPAFAYAVVALLLYPRVASRIRREERRPEVVVASRDDGDEVKQAPLAHKELAPARPLAPVPPLAAAPEQRAAAVTETADARPNELAETAHARSDERAAGSSHDLSGSLSKLSAPPEWPVVTLEPGAEAAIAAATLHDGVRLAIPLPAALRDQPSVQLALVGPDDAREVRQRVQVREGAASVHMVVPAAWLERGRYRVEVAAVTLDATAGRVRGAAPPDTGAALRDAPAAPAAAEPALSRQRRELDARAGAADVSVSSKKASSSNSAASSTGTLSFVVR